MKCAPGFEKGLMLDVELTLDFKKHWQGLEGLIVVWGHHILTGQGAESGENKGGPWGAPRQAALLEHRVYDFLLCRQRRGSVRNEGHQWSRAPDPVEPCRGSHGHHGL